MAKILQGIGVEAISGTIGGTTFQKWRGLLVARGKPTPSNPMTERQTRIRSIVSTISRAWRDVLTAGQRTAWNQHAEVFPWYDVFGRSMSLRGISLFLKMNTVLLDHDKSMQIEPPPAVEPPELTGLTVVPDPATINVTVPQLAPGIITAQEPFIDIWVAGGFTSTEVDVEGGTFTVEINSQCLPQGRKAQKSDYRHVLYVDDKEIVTPPSVGSDIFIKPPVANTKNCVCRLQRYNKNGRYSVPVVFSGIRTGI